MSSAINGRSQDSRLSKSDRADATNHRNGPSRGESLKLPLTERDGVALREEVRDYGALDGDRPLSWRESVRQWRDYIEETEDTDMVFQNGETGEYATGSDPHRFASDYSAKQYAKLKDLERDIGRDFGKRLHTAMLQLTGSSTDDDGNPIPPVDHLHDLDQSWEAVRRELSRCLENKRWEYLAILEPHESGYLHIHIAVFVEGYVTRETFAPVIEAHLRNSPIAGEDAHQLDEDTVSVRHAGGDRDRDDDDHLDELACYLAEYLGTYGEDPLQAPDHQQMSNTVLWATGKQRWRPSQGAQSYMASFQREDGDSPWEAKGIVQGTDYYPVTDDSGGVDRFVTSTDSLDPPD